MKKILLMLISIFFLNITYGFTKIWDFSNSGDYNISNTVEVEFSGGMGNLKKIKLPSIYSENYNSDFEFQAGPEYFSISSNIYSGGTTFQISGGYSLLESKNYLYSTERENLAETLYSLYRDNVYIKKPVGYIIK